MIDRDGVTRAEQELELELAGYLNRWAEEERALVDEARAAAGPRDREAAAELERLALAPAPRRRPLWPAAALLAVGLALGWLARGLLVEDDPPRTPAFMGSLLEAPLGTVERYDRFEWKPVRTDGERYTLRVWNAGGTRTVIEATGLEAPSYAPTPAELDGLGDAIRWEVGVTDGSGAERVLGPIEVRRSP